MQFDCNDKLYIIVKIGFVQYYTKSFRSTKFCNLYGTTLLQIFANLYLKNGPSASVTEKTFSI